VDMDQDCEGFAERGECDSNPGWMLENCRKSCGVCSQEDGEEISCKDHDKECAFWASVDECEKNPSYMLENCKKSCKVCDSDGNGVDTEEEDNEEEEPHVECKDKRSKADCVVRQKAGECEKNPGWMIVFCGKTCGKCDLLLQKQRCVPEVFNDTKYRYEDALQKQGDLTRIFENVLAEFPTTQVLLKPPKGPWLVKLPNFVTMLERDTLLNLTIPHVKRSTDQGTFNKEGIQEQIVSTGRTSSNAWCMSETCMSNPIVQGLTEKIAKLLLVPTKNFESYQVLQYKLGQKYDVHHDSSEEDLDDLAGPRILTFFIYLSNVEEGGETFFDKLDIKVKPETGSAILWPSVLDEDPNKIDWRTTHAALPVMKGEKLAANVWIHMRDFETANLWGCTGAFDD